VREVKFTQLRDALVATVEFFERVISNPRYVHLGSNIVSNTGYCTCCSYKRQETVARGRNRSPSSMEVHALCYKLPGIGGRCNYERTFRTGDIYDFEVVEGYTNDVV